MNNQKIKAAIFWVLVISIASTNYLFAQTNSNQLLVRDSLDYKDNKITINTTQNEFSPIPYKGGLLYISKKSAIGKGNLYNRVYWTANPKFKISDSLNNIDSSKFIKLSKFEKSDDFTAPTSNDNNILVNYTRIKNKFNNVEQEFIGFSSEQAFAYDDSAKLIVYAKKRKMILGGIAHWELWQANLILGKLKNKHRINFDDNAADYLYPFIDHNDGKLYFASNKKDGKGGYDLYYVNKDGNNFGTHPIALNEINSINDDIAIFKNADVIYFSSNRVGGLGGFDIYNYDQNKTVTNLGYPLNTSQDEVSLQKINNDYYLTTNRNGNFDIFSANYLPVKYNINGLLLYKSDSTIAPNHKMYYKDADTGLTIDTLFSDNNAKYSFTGKPNRNYIFTTLNGDSIIEYYSIITNANQKTFDYITTIGGRSPKQKADSIQALLAALEKRRLDSIDATGITTKFVVHFGFNKYNIENKEKYVLDYLLTKLKNLPNTYIAIGAFTDCIGSDKYNYNLSVNRAKSVYHYLVSHGLNKKQILTNGYANKFNITPCITKSSKNNIKAQSDNRRAEVVLSNEKNQNWESLEKARGSNYYKIFNASSKVATTIVSEKTVVLLVKDTIQNVLPKLIIKKDTIVKPVIVAKPTFKKDTIAIKDTIVKKVVVTKPIIKKDTVVKSVIVAKPTVKKDTIAKKDTIVNKVVVTKPIIKKDTVVKPVIVAKSIVKKDTIAKKDTIVNKVVATKPIIKKDTIIKKENIVKKDTVVKSVIVAKPAVKKDSIVSAPIMVTQAKQATNVDLTKEEIIKALDSLAKLKIEQERIVAYLTLRINNKPIDIYVNSDSVTIELYDNGVHDKDSVSVIYNNRIVVDRQELKVNQPIKFKLKVDANMKNNEMVMVAENLGTEPPNTAVMFITEKSGKRQQVILNTDMTHNGVVYFIRIGKQ